MVTDAPETAPCGCVDFTNRFLRAECPVRAQLTEHLQKAVNDSLGEGVCNRCMADLAIVMLVLAHARMGHPPQDMPDVLSRLIDNHRDVVVAAAEDVVKSSERNIQ